MPDGDGGTLLARRLNHLFRTSRPQGRNWTNREVADEVKRVSPGLKVSGAYLSALRTGKRTNPSADLLNALAKFFGVSPAYFVDSGHAERVDAQLAALNALSQSGVRGVALRAVGLPPESLAAITAVIDQVRQLQGLPPVEE
ncbi:helix-turn-helix domain-containing protein [Streptomyces mobaraensis]|uniref:helix-turn-helix domain-containing protein n=1 Tax=Streptomyces sp. TYQ1024 TaxID=2762559 RepID=UPI00163B6464|nr:MULTISPECIES: helix-turn-helix transcriptional regulator [Streptomyces]MBC2876890.1 helix-turn-helix domain-containing protein [Streptomyces sp. TYQ1024]UBI40972.1 helix-turn-helix domain-containing protein [Streptomyces mobaraensis]UKW33452.1 helix-turn-helix domain-containing protein [Streptomyces sp. TYQ1024]